MLSKKFLFDNRKEMVIGMCISLAITGGIAQSTVASAANYKTQTLAVSKRIVDDGVVNTRPFNINDYTYTFNVHTESFTLEPCMTEQTVIAEEPVALSEEVASNILEEERKITEEVNNLLYNETIQNQSKVLTEEELCARAEYNVLNDVEACSSEKKTYMKYQLVTDEGSAQYKLLNSEECYTDMNTGIRMVGDRYCIAIGTGYGAEVGTCVDLVLADESIVKCIVAEVKSDAHTDEETHTYHVGGYDKGKYYAGDGSVAEFVVDGDVYFNLCDGSGTVNWVDGLSGKILKVVVIPDDVVVVDDFNV